MLELIKQNVKSPRRCSTIINHNKTIEHNRGISSQLSRNLHTVSSQHQVQELDLKSSRIDSNVSLAPHVDENLSYAFGKSHKEFNYCTLSSLIDQITKREPHSTAVVVYDEGISKSFEEFQSDLNKLVNGLVGKLNLKRGDNVGIYSYNNYQFLLLQFACTKLGLVFYPINPSYKIHELAYVLSNANLKILFMPGKNSKQSALNNHWSTVCDNSLRELQAKGSLNNLKSIVLLDGEFEEKEMSLGNMKINRWHSIVSKSNILESLAQDRIKEVRPDDIYGVYYTSGTTGFPKGAAITQFNVINNVALTCDRLFVQRGPQFQSIRPNICLPLPLFHEFAGVLGIISPFIDGGSFVITGMKYDIKSVYDSIMRFKCNTIFLTPTILIDLLGYVNQVNGRNSLPLKTLLVAGSSVLPELIQKAHKTLPDLEEIRIAYGSSENGVIATIQTTQENPDRRLSTVGSPLDFTEIRIVDANTERILPIGQAGEVQTRGFNTMLYYYNDPDKTSNAITSSRWYRTGDLGVMDKYGSLQIVGRIKDLIIKGGENVYPAEVENILHTHELIEDAHVIGVPDKRYGEEICVWVKLKKPIADIDEDEDSIRQNIIGFCKDKMTYFKVPKYVMFVDQFPLTPVKKVKKFEMRAQTIRMLKLQ